LGAAPLFFRQTAPFEGRFWLSNYYVFRKGFSRKALQGLKKQPFFKKTGREFKCMHVLQDFVRTEKKDAGP
jgi:hypothetical protein